MTLIEAVVSLSLLTVIAGSVVSGLTFSRKMAESNLAQSYAQMTAQSIVEQIVRVPTAILEDTTETGVRILIPFVTTDNTVTMEDVEIPWATTEAYSDLGPAEDPTLGVLVDAAYIANGNVIRPTRYMKMRVNLQRIVEATEARTTIQLRYQWEIPDRKASDGSPIYLSGELRTVRSKAVSF